MIVVIGVTLRLSLFGFKAVLLGKIVLFGKLLWMIVAFGGGREVARFGVEFWFLVLTRANLFLQLAIGAARIVVFVWSGIC